MLICEMAAFYKYQNKTLIDVLKELYEEYGYYFDKVDNLLFEGSDGMNRMALIMDDLREKDLSEICGYKITAKNDYLTSEKNCKGIITHINLPSANVISFEFEDGSIITVRPSGTEPKLKVYYSLKSENQEDALKKYNLFKKDIEILMPISCKN